MVTEWGRYLAFAILLYLGITMIRESHKEEDDERDLSSFASIFSATSAPHLEQIIIFNCLRVTVRKDTIFLQYGKPYKRTAYEDNIPMYI